MVREKVWIGNGDRLEKEKVKNLRGFIKESA